MTLLSVVRYAVVDSTYRRGTTTLGAESLTLFRAMGGESSLSGDGESDGRYLCSSAKRELSLRVRVLFIHSRVIRVSVLSYVKDNVQVHDESEIPRTIRLSDDDGVVNELLPSQREVL